MTDYLKELAELPPINRGVGWYWTRGGLPGVARMDLPETGPFPLIGHILTREGDRDRWHIRTWMVTGNWGQSRHPDDLVLFIGPDRPEQSTYAEWRAAEVAERDDEPLLNWWCVNNGYGAQHFDTLAEAKLFARGRASHKIIHMREVREPSTSEPSDAEWDGNPQDGELTDAEATAAYDAAEPVPLSPERIEELVKYATGKDAEPVEPSPPEILSDAGLPPCEPMLPAIIPVEPAEPVAERELLEAYLNIYDGWFGGAFSHDAAIKTAAPTAIRTAVHVREVPEGEEVRCWVLVKSLAATTSENIAKCWIANGHEVVECVGYRKVVK